MAIKTRFHKGQTAYLRARLRLAGIKVDEEVAQLIMAGRTIFPPHSSQQETVSLLQHEAWQNRHQHSRTWEETHPGRNPFPKSFAERVHELARDGYRASQEEGGDPGFYLMRLEEMARAELDEENPFLPGTDNYRYAEDPRDDD
jgi:hypothetical protein